MLSLQRISLSLSLAALLATALAFGLLATGIPASPCDSSGSGLAWLLDLASLPLLAIGFLANVAVLIARRRDPSLSARSAIAGMGASTLAFYTCWQ